MSTHMKPMMARIMGENGLEVVVAFFVIVVSIGWSQLITMKSLSHDIAAATASVSHDKQKSYVRSFGKNIYAHMLVHPGS